MSNKNQGWGVSLKVGSSTAVVVAKLVSQMAGISECTPKEGFRSSQPAALGLRKWTMWLGVGHQNNLRTYTHVYTSMCVCMYYCMYVNTYIYVYIYIHLQSYLFFYSFTLCILNIHRGLNNCPYIIVRYRVEA